MIYDNVRRLCQERGVKFAEVEAATGVGKNVIYRWKDVLPSLKNAKKVADYFGVTVDDLLKEEA